MTLSLIVAMAKNRVIGAKNKLPWRIPEDLKRFREITLGHPVIMGRKTWESIGRPLPGRSNIVVSRQPGFSAEGVTVVGSLDAAIDSAAASGSDEIFVIGGGEIYRQALSRADRIYLTLLERDVDGDAFFPDFSEDEFKEIAREERTEPERFCFVVLKRQNLFVR
jgi:dihydrofolate reductase